LHRVGAIIDACREGSIERHYQPGHPHAFVSAIYMGEVAHGQCLWDPSGALRQLKGRTRPYPRRLREALVDTFLGEAEFAIANARDGRALEDTLYVTGCAFRCMACLCQVLCAINGVYLLNEKGALAAAQALAARPLDLEARVRWALSAIASARAADGLEALERRLLETRAIA
jgi:hypothetical protein